jgi:hypothetical protein
MPGSCEHRSAGLLYATMHGNATDPSAAAWKDFVEAHRVTLKRRTDSPLPFPIN